MRNLPIPHRTKLNIGGGPGFNFPDWINLEEVVSRDNPEPFFLTPTCNFPAADNSMKLVYTSHALEHLTNSTVERVLSETHRVLKDGGDFLIKIPDFDNVLRCWRENDPFVMGPEWYFESILHTWKNRGVEDSISNRTAAIFCSFWNRAYGDHFSLQISNDPTAYHGPPVVPADSLDRLLRSSSPSEISADLRRRVLDEETEKVTFNHQNAWSREELKVVLEQAGFRTITFDNAEVIDQFADVPGIEEMKLISLYCLARS